ncbi:MAG: flagellar biosynthesis anti-sigma factor FlgM [Planctomycetota bacterium]|jgi:anti-sigma28 factor (negative regulator of flagellin synthesis)
MEIQGPNGTDRSRQVYFQKIIARLRAAGVDASTAADEVEISDVGRFLSFLSQLPAVRQERVDELRSQIEHEEYDVEGKIEDIVDEILEDLGIPPTPIKR